MKSHDDNAVVTKVPVGSGRKWVWRSTLASRAAGQVSILACGETIGAVAFYWLAAYAYDTHWHLISSAVIAPLLLLRSPESIATGVNWVSKDWFGLERYENWSWEKKALWLFAVALVTAFLIYFVADWLAGQLLVGRDGWILFSHSALVGMISIVVALAFAFAIVGARMGSSDQGVPGAIATGVANFIAGLIGASAAVSDSSAVGISGALAGGIVTAIIGAAATSIALEGEGPSVGIAIALRALFFRVAATLRYLISGIKRLPENWRENNFLTDTSIPAELMPGIRDLKPIYSQDKFMAKLSEHFKKRRVIVVLYLITAIFFFVPSFFYRINIKATAWFWWPLVYLLTPPPVANTAGEEKQAICGPMTNPFQRNVILISVLLTIGSLVAQGIDRTYWNVLKDLPALQFVIKVAFAIDWAHITPWHWAQWLIAGSGIGMLWLAGDALSHDKAGNWEVYRQRLKSKTRQMTAFRRLRYLGAVGLLLLALGALLLKDRFWQEYVPVPEHWIAAMERFYGTGYR